MLSRLFMSFQDQRRKTIKKQKIIKNTILKELCGVLDVLMDEDRDPEDSVLYGYELTDRVLACVEAMFLYGLNASSNSNRDEKLWLLFQRASPDHVTEAITQLDYIYTTTARCRAYIRDMLNSPGAPVGLSTVLREERSLQRLVCRLYRNFAMVRQGRQFPNVMRSLDIFQQCFKLQLRLDHPTLNRWPALTLRLAGISCQSVPLTHLAPVIARPPSLQMVKADIRFKTHKTKVPAFSGAHLQRETLTELSHKNAVLTEYLSGKAASRVASTQGPSASHGCSQNQAAAAGPAKAAADEEEYEDEEDEEDCEDEPVFISVYDAFFDEDGDLVYTAEIDVEEGEEQEERFEELFDDEEEKEEEEVEIEKEEDVEVRKMEVEEEEVEIEKEEEMEVKKVEVKEVEVEEEKVEIEKEEEMEVKKMEVEEEEVEIEKEEEMEVKKMEVEEEEVEIEKEEEMEVKKVEVKEVEVEEEEKKEVEKGEAEDNLSVLENTEETLKQSAEPEAGEDDPHKKLRAMLAEEESHGDHDTEKRNAEDEDAKSSTAESTEESPPKTKFTWRRFVRIVLERFRSTFVKKPKVDPEKLSLLHENFLDTYTVDSAASSSMPKVKNPLVCGVCIQPLDDMKWRLCSLSGQRCCRVCHTNKKAIIPYNIMNDFDFNKYPVCDVAYRHLRQTETRVWIEDLCFEGEGGETAFARHTACTICLRGNVVILNWMLGKECGPKLLVQKQKRLADIHPGNTALIRRFSVRELVLVKKKKLPKMLMKTLKKQQKHLDKCPLHVQPETSGTNDSVQGS